MTKTVNTQEQKFDSFGYVKRSILNAYCKNMLKGEDTKNFDFEIKNYYSNSFVMAYLNKVGALKVANVAIAEDVDATTGKLNRRYVISIKDFDVDTVATSKAGKEFRIFNTNDIGYALLKAKRV